MFVFLNDIRLYTWLRGVVSNGNTIPDNLNIPWIAVISKILAKNVNPLLFLV